MLSQFDSASQYEVKNNNLDVPKNDLGTNFFNLY